MNEECKNHGIENCPDCTFVPLRRLEALAERIRGMEGALKGANEQLRMALHMENGAWRKHVADAIRNLKQAKAALPQPPKEKP